MIRPVHWRRAVLGVAAMALALMAACSGARPPAGAAKLRVLAAASLAEAFKEVGAAFQKANPGVEVEFSFAGSNQLRGQLEQGGPGDVFVSADRKQMDAAAASKVIDPASVRAFASNTLALIVPKASGAGIKGLSDLARPGLKIVVADKAVPVGNAASLMLGKAAGLAEVGPAVVKGIEANIVSHEASVAGVVAKVALGEADAGFAYASDAAGANAERILVVPLPAGLEQRSEYVAATTVRSTNPEVGGRFVEFLKSDAAAAVLQKRGFKKPGGGPP